MDIWDLHCHLSGVPGNTPQARLGKMLEYADRMGIARLCLYMGMEWSYDPSPEKLRQDNDEVLRALRHFPERAYGFVYLNLKHTQASLDELNRCVRDGPMVGVKLWVAQHCNAPELDPLSVAAFPASAASSAEMPSFSAMLSYGRACCRKNRIAVRLASKPVLSAASVQLWPPSVGV